MAAPHYAEILTGGPRPVFGEPPARLGNGAWKLWFILNDASDAGTSRTLLWIKGVSGDGLVVRVHEDGGCKIQVFDNTGLVVERLVTFAARQRVKITLDAEAGTLRVQGATTGNGTRTGTPWSVTAGGGEWRIGTNDSGGSPARGYVSPPYGLQTDDPLPEWNDSIPDDVITLDTDDGDAIETDDGEELLVD